MFTIGKLAGLTSVSNDTLRYYEHEGLIRPIAKSAAGYRLYDQDSARRIHFIKHAQSCGFTHASATKPAAATFAHGQSRRSCRSKAKSGR